LAEPNLDWCNIFQTRRRRIPEKKKDSKLLQERTQTMDVYEYTPRSEEIRWSDSRHKCS
jgi:hypothetical protein